MPGLLERVPLLFAWAACLRIVSAPPLVAQPVERGFTPVSAEVLNRPSADDWPQYRRTHDNWAHSPLDQIDRGNVGLLQLAWSRAIQPGPMEMTPLVYMGVMYLVHPSSRVEAVNATTGDLLWAYQRTLPEGISPTGTMRNLALYGDMVYYSSRDGYLVALRARTGEVVWERFMGGSEFATNYTSGPVAANDVIVTGRSCGLFGGVHNTPGGCYVLAHDAVACQYDCPARGARGRYVGRSSDYGALPRFAVECEQLRSRAEPRLHRHRSPGTVPLHRAGTRRGRCALLELDARDRCGHGWARLVLSAPARG